MTAFQRNGTTFGDGTFNSYTGQADYSQLNRVHTFNNQTSTHFAGKCGEMDGSADGFFPPYTFDTSAKTAAEMPDSVRLFTHQACRYMTYIKEEANTGVHFGLPYQEYRLDNRTFANASVYEPNTCFQNNIPSGMQNNSFCGGENVPLYLSFPHFYTADDYYMQQFSKESDLRPSTDLHGSMLRLDPVMSALTFFKFALQLNVKIYPMPR